MSSGEFLGFEDEEGDGEDSLMSPMKSSAARSSPSSRRFLLASGTGFGGSVESGSRLKAKVWRNVSLERIEEISFCFR